MFTSSRCCRLGAAGLAASVAAVTLVTGTASAVDRSQPTLNRGGDARADLGVFRIDELTGDIRWIWSSGETDVWGNVFEEDDTPIIGDFDGDGRNDPAVYRAGTPSTWFIKGTASGQRAVQFGDADRFDTPVHGDFDGDGKADLAVVRSPMDGDGALADGPLTWYVARSSGGSSVFAFGNAGDTPVPANYVGGAASDLAVRRFEPDGTTAVYIRNATGGTDRVAWGRNHDDVVMGDYDGDGRNDISVVRAVPFDPAEPGAPALLRWFIRLSGGGRAVVDYGEEGDVPVFADYTGDRRTDLGVVRYPVGEPDEASTTPLEWYVRSSNNGATSRTVYGDPDDLPVSFVYLLLLNAGERSDGPEVTMLEGLDDRLRSVLRQ